MCAMSACSVSVLARSRSRSPITALLLVTIWVLAAAASHCAEVCEAVKLGLDAN